MHSPTAEFEYEEDELESILYLDEEKYFFRPSTAPARPLTEIEEFRRSHEFFLLEQSVIVSSQLVHRNNDKYDLDSQDGQLICRKYLKILEKLHDAFQSQTASRIYRSEFSKAYKILYKQGSLCYLTEILDSSQEGFPYLWVNGEKYIFSNEVLEAGKKLFSSFCKIQYIARDIYSRSCSNDSKLCQLPQIKTEMKRGLEEFDHDWVMFEQLYVLELMLIEADSRRFITEPIETERALLSLEIREKAKGRILFSSVEYHKLREQLATHISRLNAVANTEGKGRDDLTIDVLVAAEGIMRKVSADQSKAVRKLAERIRKAFLTIRLLMRKYDQNIEIVDPQLKNNPELVEALCAYESSWEKGKMYFLSGKICGQLIIFSQIIEATAEKYREFQEQIECRDADIFVTIPSLLLLRSFEDNDKGISKYFLPAIDNPEHRLGKIYLEIRTTYLQECKKYNYYEYYNYFERLMLNLKLEKETFKHKTKLEELVPKIKELSIELQRAKPSEWNSLLDILLDDPSN